MVEGVFSDPREVGGRFGLDPKARFHPISAEEARLTLAYVLSHEMVYRSPCMARRRAERFVETFTEAARLDDPESRCYSNGANPPMYVESPWRTWDPATLNATFDAGVLVIARDQGACLWVEDED